MARVMAVPSLPSYLATPQAQCPSIELCRSEIQLAERSARQWRTEFSQKNGSSVANGVQSASLWIVNGTTEVTHRGSHCMTLEACQEHWKAAQLSLLLWRRAAGMLSCLRTNSGPTGGFCQFIATVRKKTNECIAKRLAAELTDLFADSSVLDVGCGLGQYGDFFANRSSSVRWLGVDGSEGIEDFTRGRVRFADLAEGIPPALARLGPWDWTMSLEVGEHVPTLGEPMFMHNLIAHARKGVILSWAAPFQGGRNHVNCQPEAYVKCALYQLGMASDDELEKRLRATVPKSPKNSPAAARECSWLRRTLMAFRPRPGAERRAADAGPMPLAQYEEQVARACNRTKHHC